MNTNRPYFLVLMTFSLALPTAWGCGGDDTTSPPPSSTSSPSIAGTYYGDLALMHNEQAKSVFASIELRVAADGSVRESKATTKSPTRVVGEPGTFAGFVRSTGDATAMPADFSITFPTLGTIKGKGNLIYASVNKGLAGNITARDGNDTVIGTLTLSVKQE